MLQKNEEKTLQKICFYYLFSIAEVIVFSLQLKKKNGPTSFYRNNLSVFLSIFFEFVFIVDGIINKNIYQIRNYPYLSVYTIVLSILNATFFSNIVFHWEIVFVVLLFIDLSITLVFYNRLKIEFKWFYYKKFGLSDELQAAYKIKQQMIVFFKLDLILTLITFLYPYTEVPYKNSVLVPSYALGLFSVFFFIVGYDEESYALRYLTMLIYLLKPVFCVLEIVSFSFVASKKTIFIPVSNSYNAYMDILLICYLYKDQKNFGKGLKKALAANTLTSHFEIQ